MSLLRRTTSFEDATIDWTPLLGVTFVLFLFFLMTLALRPADRLEAQEAAVRSGAARAPETLVVTVTSAGIVQLRGERLDFHALRPAIERSLARLSKARVMIVADEAARASLIARVVDQCRLAGADEIRLNVRGEGVSHGG